MRNRPEIVGVGFAVVNPGGGSSFVTRSASEAQEIRRCRWSLQLPAVPVRVRTEFLRWRFRLTSDRRKITRSASEARQIRWCRWSLQLPALVVRVGPNFFAGASG